MLPPNPHETAVTSASGGPQPTDADDSDTDNKPVGDDGNPGMFANMFETAVGMAAEAAEQQLGIDEDGGEGAEEEEEGQAEDNGGGSLTGGQTDRDEESGGREEDGSNDEAGGL